MRMHAESWLNRSGRERWDCLASVRPQWGAGGPDSTGYTLDSLDPEVRMDTYSFASEETLTLKSDSSLQSLVEGGEGEAQ